MPLTNTALKAFKPSDKTQRHFDGGGLYIEVSPAGGKYWRLKYRINGKEKRLSFGVYPEVSLKEAREERDAARKLIARGADPSAVRKANKQLRRESAENNFEAVGRAWFAKQRDSWAPKHAEKVIRRLEIYIFPKLGTLPIADIAPADVLSAVLPIEEKGFSDTAHRALNNCSQIFRYAVAARLIDSDPTRDLRGSLKPKSRTDHFAAVTEPVRVAGLLRAIRGYQGTAPVEAALKLAPLTFVRPGELRQAKWSNIDLDAAEWRFVMTKKNRDHVVPLSRQAVEILRELHPVTGRGEYVFPNARRPKGDRPMSDNAVLAAFRRMGIEKEEMTGHGFRAMARTILDEVLGFRVDYIEHQLSHKVIDPTGRAYNRTKFLEERRTMMQAWADYLDQLCEGSNVAGIGGARRRTTKR